jgi:hypothetical protein
LSKIMSDYLYNGFCLVFHKPRKHDFTVMSDY